MGGTLATKTNRYQIRDSPRDKAHRVLSRGEVRIFILDDPTEKHRAQRPGLGLLASLSIISGPAI